MKVCYFGNYKSDYSRNRILMSGLKLNGIEVLQCNSRKTGFFKYIDLFFKHQKIKNKYDIVIVGFPGYQTMLLAKLISKKKIIFDAFTSIYDSMVWDRQETSPNSIKAKYYYFLDFLSCRLADIVLLDTKEHIDYFVEQFKLPKQKLRYILVGSDDGVIFPQNLQKSSNKFVVHFHGSNIPLQGLDYIIKATQLLQNQNIEFKIIGTSIKNKYKDKNFSNIVFLENVPYEDLGAYMSRADVCLGIFGHSDKADRVIANKVFEAMACSRPIITGRSSAAVNFFKDRENVLLVNMADAKDLADKILLLQNDRDLADKIAQNAYDLFKAKASPKGLGKDLLNIINEISKK